MRLGWTYKILVSAVHYLIEALSNKSLLSNTPLTTGNSKVEQNHFNYFWFFVWQESAHYILAVECQDQSKDLISKRLTRRDQWMDNWIYSLLWWCIRRKPIIMWSLLQRINASLFNHNHYNFLKFDWCINCFIKNLKKNLKIIFH